MSAMKLERVKKDPVAWNDVDTINSHHRVITAVREFRPRVAPASGSVKISQILIARLKGLLA